MSAEFIFRIIGMIVFGSFGVWGGGQFGTAVGEETQLYAVILGLLGMLAGLVLTPYITNRPVLYIRQMLGQVSAQTLFAALAGLIVGLIIAALLSFMLSSLPEPFGQVLPFISAMFFSYLGVAVFVMRQNDIFAVLRNLSGRSPDSPLDSPGSSGRTILLDTSVIIDGRISDVARTGFLAGELLIPRFVLNELQYIADSADNLRRQRGRRGLEVLSQLQKDSEIPVRISDIDVEGSRQVDDKLIILARQLRAPVMTNDFNLNRVAELQGVTILNINELANAVKAVFLPGEELSIRIIQEGREAGQGVGYLDDGTMVVVEGGVEHQGSETQVEVTKVLQTAAGRMIFARPVE